MRTNAEEQQRRQDAAAQHAEDKRDALHVEPCQRGFVGKSRHDQLILHQPHTRGLQGAADRNGDRKVTARELFNYVNPRVISDTEGQQHPQMWGKFDDSMVVVYVK